MAALVGQQVDFAGVEVHGMHGDQLRAEQAQAAQPLDRAYAVLLQAFLDLVNGFVDVHVDRDFQLGGQGGDLFEGLVGHGVGCVRRQAEIKQWIAAQGVADASPLAR
jgi:hypothetical protein